MSDRAFNSPAKSRPSSAGPDSGSDDEEIIVIDPDLIIFTSYLKYRDNKRWKTRYGVLTKISPAAGKTAN
ncbi:hypothetical protein GE061_011532 [Apolygus lucorum]|uniref:Uncharacterized protein n=1 Tax=Apolygus lucorum TaxID=248454 RepID=A0A8S9XXN1_APOLU|nr:hypothetical protein GE061_011532 [Apolygus lucorum]